jgi:hypothetical protein
VADFDFTPEPESGLDPDRVKGVVLGVLWLITAGFFFWVGGRVIKTGVLFVAVSGILVFGQTILYGVVAYAAAVAAILCLAMLILAISTREISPVTYIIAACGIALAAATGWHCYQLWDE